MCVVSEAELKLPLLQRDLTLGLKEGSQGLLPLPAPYHSTGPTVSTTHTPQQHADVANDSEFSSQLSTALPT